ncbi:MAG: hypothetical protein DRP03_01665 [Candidatus Aenigmatarchaeota archaeon]|nr:MAG: hypothetical protein DRP03_01665 [Candidatus Aenigmarchaeota archaeon]
MTKKLSKRKLSHQIEGEISEFVILHDSLDFLGKIKSMMENVVELSSRRYKIYKGSYKGKEITLVHTHMGAGNTALVVDQLIDNNACYLLKIGTFGALQGDWRLGDILVPIGAVRCDGVSDAYVLREFPAVPHIEFVKIISKVLDNAKARYRYGIVWSTNAYMPIVKDSSPDIRFRYETWRNAGVVGVEMECSSLFIASCLRNVKAAAILVCNREWSVIDAFRKGKNVDWNGYKRSKRMKIANDLLASLALRIAVSTPNNVS